jgi:hypothetical protein
LEKKHKQIANMKLYYVGCRDTLVDVGKKKGQNSFQTIDQHRMKFAKMLKDY